MSLRTYDHAQDLIEIHIVVVDYLKDFLIGDEIQDLSDTQAVLEKSIKLSFSAIPDDCPTLRETIGASLTALFNGNKISLTAIIDIMTLMHPASDDFFYDGCKLLRNGQGDGFLFFLNVLWMRCWLGSE